MLSKLSLRRNIYLLEYSKMLTRMRHVKKFTKKGYKIMEIPAFLYKTILDQRMTEKPENNTNCKDFFQAINCNKVLENGNITEIIRTQTIKYLDEKTVHKTIDMKMRPILEKWAKTKLSATKRIFFPIRRYLRGSNLLLHTDGLPVRIISAILQVSSAKH